MNVPGPASQLAPATDALIPAALAARRGSSSQSPAGPDPAGSSGAAGGLLWLYRGGHLRPTPFDLLLFIYLGLSVVGLLVSTARCQSVA